MVSRFIGKDQSERIGSVVGTATKSALFVTLPLVAISLLLPDRILSVFTLDESLLGAGVRSLRVVALAMLVVIPGEMWFTAVIGAGDTRAALAIETLLTLVMLGFSYVVAILLSGSLEMVWVSLPIASLVCLTASYAWMKAGVWRRLEF